MRNLLLLLILLLLLVPVTGYADAIDDIAHRRMAEDQVPGVVVAIHDGDVLDIRSYGVADLTTKEPVTADSVFEYASITKGLTGTALMRLVQDGLVELDDSVQEHLPGAPDSWQPVTIRHSLTHSSGFQDILLVLANVKFDGRFTAENQLAALYEHKPSGRPGGKFWYTNTGAFVVGQIIANTSGLGYSDYVAKHVFEPAGMTSVGFLGEHPTPENKVSIYTLRKNEHVPWELENEVGLGDDLAWCGVFGVAEDLIKYADAFRNYRILEPPTVAMMLDGTLRTKSGTLVTNGWFIREYEQGDVIAHQGHTGTAFMAFMDRPTTFVLLSNLAKGNQFPFGADQGHSARGFLEEVMQAYFAGVDTQ